MRAFVAVGPERSRRKEVRRMTDVEKREMPAVATRDWWSRWFEDFPAPRWFPDPFRRFADMGEPMKVEEFLEGDTLVVKAEMPGLDPDNDVSIDVADHLLRIRAERRQETKTEDKSGYHSEFSYGMFSRSVPLPFGATDKDVEANYKDGILEVRIPVDKGQAERRRIPIARG
jgi:HSP20 family protein